MDLSRIHPDADCRGCLVLVSRPVTADARWPAVLLMALTAIVLILILIGENVYG